MSEFCILLLNKHLWEAAVFIYVCVSVTAINHGHLMSYTNVYVILHFVVATLLGLCNDLMATLKTQDARLK